MIRFLFGERLEDILDSFKSTQSRLEQFLEQEHIRAGAIGDQIARLQSDYNTSVEEQKQARRVIAKIAEFIA